MSPTQSPTRMALLRATRWFPWIVLLCGGLVLSLNLGVRQSLGLFIPDMLNDTGWTASTFGLAFAIQNLMWGVATPFAGAIADKFGSMRVLALGAIGPPARHHLLEVLKDLNWRIRVDAVKALGAVGVEGVEERTKSTRTYILTIFFSIFS